jgi:hypothetical protein
MEADKDFMFFRRFFYFQGRFWRLAGSGKDDGRMDIGKNLGRFDASRICKRIFPLFLSLLVPWGNAGAEEAPRPVSFYMDAALSNNPSLSAMQERIRMKRTPRSAPAPSTTRRHGSG